METIETTAQSMLPKCEKEEEEEEEKEEKEEQEEEEKEEKEEEEEEKEEEEEEEEEEGEGEEEEQSSPEVTSVALDHLLFTTLSTLEKICTKCSVLRIPIYRDYMNTLWGE